MCTRESCIFKVGPMLYTAPSERNFLDTDPGVMAIHSKNSKKVQRAHTQDFPAISAAATYSQNLRSFTRRSD